MGVVGSEGILREKNIDDLDMAVNRRRKNLKWKEVEAATANESK